MNGISTEEVEKMAVPKHAYVMDYISDKDTYRAVMFARQMIRNGTHAPIAIRKAAHYYQVDMSDVAHYVAQTGGRSKK